MSRWCLCAAVGLLAGCVPYRPKPIDPPRLEKEFRGRTLADPGLRAFVVANGGANAGPGPSEWPPPKLGLPDLVLAGFYFSAELDAARARVEIAEAGIVTAGARPNPSVGIGGGYTNSPESPLVFRVSPSFTIETAGKRGYRILQAQSLAEAARLELAGTAWRIRSSIRTALADHLFALRERDLLEAEEAVRAEAVTIMVQRLTVGEVSRPDVDLARTDLLSVSLLARAAAGRVNETLAALAAAMGVPVSALGGAQLDWPEFDKPPGEGALSLATVQRAGLLNRIDLRRLLAEYAAADASLRLELARQYPNIDLGPGYDFDEGHNKFTFGPALTLPLFNRNQGPIAEAAARRNEMAARFATLQAEAIGEMEKSLAQYRSALAELALADSQLVTLQQVREKATGRALQVGEADRLALAGVRVQSAVAARARLDTLRKARAALGGLEQSVKRPLDAGLALPETPLEKGGK